MPVSKGMDKRDATDMCLAGLFEVLKNAKEEVVTTAKSAKEKGNEEDDDWGG